MQNVWTKIPFAAQCIIIAIAAAVVLGAILMLMGTRVTKRGFDSAKECVKKVRGQDEGKKS